VLQGQWANKYGNYSTLEGNENRVLVEHDYDSFDGLEKVKVWRSWDLEVESGQGLQITVEHGGGTAVHAISIGAGAWCELEKVYSPVLDDVTRIALMLRHNNTGDGGSVAIQSIRLEGTGDNPPES
jgi:hypothetical protein